MPHEAFEIHHHPPEAPPPSNPPPPPRSAATRRWTRRCSNCRRPIRRRPALRRPGPARRENEDEDEHRRATSADASLSTRPPTAPGPRDAGGRQRQSVDAAERRRIDRADEPSPRKRIEEEMLHRLAARRPRAARAARAGSPVAFDTPRMASTPPTMPREKSSARRCGTIDLGDDPLGHASGSGALEAVADLEPHPRSCFATSRITPSSTPLAAHLPASATRIPNSSIVSGPAVGTSNTTTWDLSRARMPRAPPRARRVDPWSSVPVRSVTRAASAAPTSSRAAVTAPPSSRAGARRGREHRGLLRCGPRGGRRRRNPPWAASRSPSRPRP